MQHGRGDGHDVGPPGADRGQLGREHVLGPAALGGLGRGLGGLRGAGRGLGGGRADLVQAVLVVLLGQRVAEALAGDHVHQHRAAEVAGPAQRVLDGLLVVAVDGPEVLQAQVLEHHLRLEDVLDALLDPVQGLEQRRAEQRRVGQRGLDVVEHLLVALRHPDRGQVVGQPADGGLVGAAVVVDHDDDPALLGPGDVVQRLPGHAAGQRAVADDRDHAAVGLAADLVGLGQAVGVGQAGRGVRVLDHVVLGLGPARVPGDAAPLAQRVEPVVAAGQQLVHVGLVAGVEDDPVGRGVEGAVQGHRELDDPEIRAQVPAGPGDGLDQHVADFRRQLGQLLRPESLEVPRIPDLLQQRHLALLFVGSGAAAGRIGTFRGAVPAGGAFRLYFAGRARRTWHPLDP